MACYGVYLDDPDEVPADWLQKTREALLDKWITTTGHRPAPNAKSWACEIYHGCRTCNEHLSLPCSLASEANEIASFLSAGCFDGEPTMFLRLYLILLSEFSGQIDQAASLMNLDLRKKPKSVCMWANKWAKHRLQILLQHHPLMAFADQYDDWATAEARYRSEPMLDNCGNVQPVRIIDTSWLERHEEKRVGIQEANGPEQALILVPPLGLFLDETIVYFRAFVDRCLEGPEKIKRFESRSFARGC